MDGRYCADSLGAVVVDVFLEIFDRPIFFEQYPQSWPRTQQADNPNEADSAFGTVVVGMDDVGPIMYSIPQTIWLDKANQIDIPNTRCVPVNGSHGTQQRNRLLQ